MKKLFFFLVLAAGALNTYAQLELTPHVVANGKFSFGGYSDPSSTEFIQSMGATESPEFPAGYAQAPTDLQGVGPYSVGQGQDAAGFLKNAGENGLTIRTYCTSATQGTETIVYRVPLAVHVALNTKGASDINVSWKGSTVLASTQNTCHIQLQYRTANDGVWVDLADNNFIGKSDAVEATQFGPTALPAALEGLDFVELRWITYLSTTGFCNTDAMNIDDIIVEAGTATPQAPTADFEANKTNLNTDEPVNFSSTSQGNPDAYAWDFGDGNTSEEKDPIHTYSKGGTYDVMLVVTNSTGSNTMLKESFITVSAAPVANFSLIADKFEVSFTDLSENDPQIWSWSFGDGGTSDEQSPAYTYSAEGEYEVVLVVENIAGADTFTKMVNVTSTVIAAEAAFDFAVSETEVVFTDNSVNNPTTFAWSFGDGTNSNKQNPSHSYGAAGSYEVCLTASNSAGGNEACQTVVIADVASAIADNKFDMTISFAPNPFENGGQLTLPSQIEEYQVQVISMTGSLISSFQNESALDLSGLSKGVYLVKVISSKGDLGVTRIVKN
jgi:PKD repeat protein